MCILVTGGAGFIGSHLVKRLLDLGREVVVLDNFDRYYDRTLKERNVAGLRSRAGFRLVEGDIRDGELLSRIAGETPLSAIIHLAARAGVRASLEDPILCADVNVNGTMQILELARRRGIRKVVFASSSSVYGERSQVPFREEEPFHHPQSPYAATKAAGEMVAWTYHQLFGIDLTCLRFFTVYGPRQRPEMAIHLFTRLMDRGEELPVFGDGSLRRDFTYIDDVVAGIISALDNLKGFRVYNLGNSNTVEVRYVLKLISAALGKPPRIKNLPLQPGDVTVTYASIDRARAELGYQPTTPIERGIEKFVEWYRSGEKSESGPSSPGR